VHPGEDRVRQGEQPRERFAHRSKLVGSVFAGRSQPRSRVEAEKLDAGARDAGEQPPVDPRELDRELWRPDLAQFRELAEDVRLLLGQRRLVESRGREPPSLDYLDDLPRGRTSARLDLGRRDRSL